MVNVVDIWECEPHLVSEVVCLKCLHRWIAVYPAQTLLKQLECGKCGEKGYVIKTGQELKKRNHKDCRYYTTKCYSGEGCLATKEIDPCKGDECENWKPKEDSE